MRMDKLMFFVGFLIIAGTSGQDIKYQGQAGCASVLPGAPTSLIAQPGDGQLIVRWNPPVNNACVDRYLVSVEPETGFRSNAQPQQVNTKDLKTTVYGLTNGQKYRISIQAYSEAFKSGGTAGVSGTPSDLCRKDVRPSGVVNLRVASTGDKFVELCWDGVENNGCVDEYRVSSIPKDQAMLRNSMTAAAKVSKGGCVKVNELDNNKAYIFYVVPYHQAHGEGPVLQIEGKPTAAPQPGPLDGINSFFTGVVNGVGSVWNGVTSGVSGMRVPGLDAPIQRDASGWGCKKVNGCKGLSLFGNECHSLGCARVKELGKCADAYQWDVDYINKVTTQYCAETCPCTPPNNPQG